MSTDSTAREVFEEVDPDPDAVLEAYGAQTPEELVAGGGEHEPTTDEELDADEAAADALFGDLSEDSLDERNSEPETPSRSESESSRSAADAVPTVDWSGETETTVDADIVVIEPSVTVQENDGRAVERDGTVLERVLEGDLVETVAARVSGGLVADSNSNSNSNTNPNSTSVSSSDSTPNSSSHSSTSHPSEDEFALVGPEPEAVRIDNTAFGADVDDFVWFGESSLDLEPDW
ncbi:hypothetical protein [Halomontanus rarus]|uniref:hypothetical protein n=1 Tax=Halomontanus rarus TaxID=3034020 RepID=UPI001A98C00D